MSAAPNGGTPPPVQIDHYSDVLCVWAYVSQVRLDELIRQFDGRISVTIRFVSVFGDPHGKQGANWADRGGLSGYGDHVAKVVAGFGHLDLHADAWRRVQPASSTGPHALVKAAQLLCARGQLDGSRCDDWQRRTLAEELSWRLRLAFFRDGRDIATRAVQLDVAHSLDLPVEALVAELDSGRADGALAADHRAATAQQVSGSPTFVLNDGRQKLYGNVGYRVIEANVEELLRRPTAGQASWC